MQEPTNPGASHTETRQTATPHAEANSINTNPADTGPADTGPSIKTVTRPPRFHWLLVSLHWLSAILVLYLLFISHEILEHEPNWDYGGNNPYKIDALQTHFAMGLAVLIFTLLRLFICWRVSAPEHASLGNPLFDFLSRASAWVLYAALLIMALSGAITAAISGAFPIVFGGEDALLPRHFRGFPSMTVHFFMSKLLMVLIAVHVLAALYHQYIVRDHLFSRMWFGNPRG